MKLLFVLPLFIIGSINSQSIEKIQIDEYSEYLNGKDIPSEYLWSSSILFHSINDSDKNDFLSRIEDQSIRDIFESSGPRTSLIELSLKFDDEYLLLAYLLNPVVYESRQLAYSEFYNSLESKPHLMDLIGKVVGEESIQFDDYNLTNHPFAAFLLNHYFSVVRVVKKEYFRSFLEHFEEFNPKSKLLEDLLTSAEFNSNYLLDTFSEISPSYTLYSNLRHFPVSTDLRDYYWSLDYVMYQTGNIDKSLEIQRNFTIPLTEYLHDRTSLNLIYSSHGGFLYKLGKYREAREVFQEALSWADRLDDQTLTTLFNNLSLVYFKTGESAKYVETQLKALEFAQSNNNFDYQIQIYRNLHVFYRKNQNPALALNYINQATELAESTSNTEALIDIYISRAAFEKSSMSNYEQALTLLNKAESLIIENTFNQSVIRILSEKADILHLSGNLDESIELQDKIVEIGKEQSDPSIFLEAVIEVAALELKRSNYGDAKRLLTQFKNHDISVVDFSVLTLAQIVEAKLAWEDEDYARAEQRYKETADLVLERARYSADLETGYWTVENEYLELFESYADFLIERGKSEEAVQLLDRVKTINDASMLQNPLITSRQLTEEQLARDRQMTRQMEGLRRRAFTATGAKKLELNTQIERLQAQKRDLHKEDRSLTRTNTANPIWSVQRSLSSNQILLHVTSINNNYYISNIDPSSISVEKLEITQERKELFEGAIESMITGRTNLELLYEVGKALGVDKLASRVTSIVMMADGYLHQLPIDVIPIEKPDSEFSYGSAKYLVEEYDTRHLNHLGELFETKTTDRKFERDYSGFGVDDFQNESTGRNLINLPRAPGEIRTIAENLTRFTRKSEFTGLNATPQTFREAAVNSRILHMATHSEISESDPLFSRIHLVPDADSDDQTNQIFAYELFDLDLNNELIMLNSCESGGDRSIQGSGIMGISRALHYAGAQSLILNAWSVNDQFAAAFANTFYTHINSGETKSRALQLAKIDFIKNNNSNPHFWGPYILNGNNDPLIQKRGASFGNVLVALIFMAGFLLVSRTRKRAA